MNCVNPIGLDGVIATLLAHENPQDPQTLKVTERWFKVTSEVNSKVALMVSKSPKSGTRNGLGFSELAERY